MYKNCIIFIMVYSQRIWFCLSLLSQVGFFHPCSLFTPSNTLPCEPVTSPGHITVHTAFRETVFAIESWRTFYWKDLFQLFSVTAVIWLIFYRYRVNTKQTTIQLYEIKYENKNIKKHKKQSFLLWYDKRFVCLLI